MAALLLDGDQLLIEPGPQWNHKTIVAVYMDRSVACKQLHLHDNTSASRLSQPKLRPNHAHRGDDHPRAGDKNRTELSGGLVLVNP